MTICPVIATMSIVMTNTVTTMVMSMTADAAVAVAMSIVPIRPGDCLLPSVCSSRGCLSPVCFPGRPGCRVYG